MDLYIRCGNIDVQQLGVDIRYVNGKNEIEIVFNLINKIFLLFAISVLSMKKNSDVY